jgi:serine/threonine-protein kinase
MMGSMSRELDPTAPDRADPLDETLRQRGVAPAEPLADTQAVTTPMAVRKPDSLPFGGKISRYLVLDVLGHGGMGVVYAAYDPALDRKIAVKLLHALAGDAGTEGRARMQREAQALARLSHPNVITVHDVSEHAGAIYIAMELVVGGTLYEWQKAKPWREVLATYCAAARGLAAAHAAELVHRDFKPENVLVGEDGRVRVTDFGLARLTTLPAEAKPVHASPTSQLASELTEAGAVMGTPSYMAPEQIEGRSVDARSDQFAWCVALWEAIYGDQPWPRGNLALRAAAMEVDIPKPPSSTPVPRGIARVLLRGLAYDPAKRWASMEEIVAELDHAMSRKRAIAIAATALAAAVLIGVFAVGHKAGAPTVTCDTAGAPIEQTWNAGARTAIAERFATTRVAYADGAAASLARSLDGFRAHWQAIAVDSCRATRETGAQSEAMLDLRTACLGRKRDELGVLVTALQHADAKLVESARTLALPDLDACNDPAQLAGVVARPTDPAKLHSLGVLETELAATEAEEMTELPLPRAKALADSLADTAKRADAIEWPPIAARARRALAGVQRDLGKGKQARAMLMQAASAATRANDADELVAIYLELADVEARLTSDYALGTGWTGLAAGTLARLGPRDDKHLQLARARGLLADKAGNIDDARAAYTEALAIAAPRGPNAELSALAELAIVEGEAGELAPAQQHLERAYALAKQELGVDHPKTAGILHDLGTIAFRRGKYEEAERDFRAALAVRERTSGSDSVDVAITAESLGISLIHDGHLADADPYLQRALHILEQRLGPDHADVANALNDIGGAYHQAGEFERELATGLRALAIREKALGPDHPDVAQSLVNVAIASKALGKWDVVLPNYRRAIAIVEHAHGVQSFDAAAVRLNFAEALRVSGRLAEAGEQYEAARVVFVKTVGEDHPWMGHIWNGIGQLEFARGHAAEAVKILEHAVALREKDPGETTALAESRFALAKALGKGSPRAAPLATAARDAFAAAGKGFAKQLAEIDAWLK